MPDVSKDATEGGAARQPAPAAAPATPGGSPQAAGNRQEPVARPYGNPQPVMDRTPTVKELHDRLPDDAPGAAETREQREARLEREKETALHPAAYPGMHRETPRGELIADDDSDPGINANIIG